MNIKHDGPVTFEYNQIANNIFIGTNMCCQTHFDEKLIKIGITADISLEKEHLDNPQGVDYFLWLPVTDHTAPQQDQLKLGVTTITQLVALNKKIYIHCKNGHGRAPTLTAAYFISTGKSVEEAITLIKEKRPSIHLDDVQIQSLEKFAQSL